LITKITALLAKGLFTLKWFLFCFCFVETGSCCVAQGGLKLLGSRDPFHLSLPRDWDHRCSTMPAFHRWFEDTAWMVNHSGYENMYKKMEFSLVSHINLLDFET
jgi:hypothetical protein